MAALTSLTWYFIVVLICICLIINDIEYLFCVPLDNLVHLLWRNVFLGLLLSFWLGYCFIFLYWAVWTVCLFQKLSPCWSKYLVSIFSPSIGCFFILFMVSFPVQKLVSLIMSPLCIFAFISFTLRDWPKKTLLQFLLDSVLLIFSSRSFMMSCFIFKSLLCFEFIFVYGVRESSVLIYIQLSRFPNTTSYLFSIAYFYLLCLRLTDHKCMGLFLGSQFCSIGPYVCFCASTTLFWIL